MDSEVVASTAPLSWLGEPEGVAFYNGEIVMNNAASYSGVFYESLMF
jgi:hypothetical protein